MRALEQYGITPQTSSFLQQNTWLLLAVSLLALGYLDCATTITTLLVAGSDRHAVLQPCRLLAKADWLLLAVLTVTDNKKGDAPKERQQHGACEQPPDLAGGGLGQPQVRVVSQQLAEGHALQAAMVGFEAAPHQSLGPRWQAVHVAQGHHCGQGGHCRAAEERVLAHVSISAAGLLSCTTCEGIGTATWAHQSKIRVRLKSPQVAC